MAPIETKSTPVAATAVSVAASTLPDASSSLRLPPCASRSRDRRAHVVEREVVEHDAVGVGRERFAQLRERLDLDFDHDVAATGGARRRRRRVTLPTAAMWFSLISTASNKPMR